MMNFIKDYIREEPEFSFIFGLLIIFFGLTPVAIGLAIGLATGFKGSCA